MTWPTKSEQTSDSLNNSKQTLRNSTMCNSNAESIENKCKHQQQHWTAGYFIFRGEQNLRLYQQTGQSKTQLMQNIKWNLDLVLDQTLIAENTVRLKSKLSLNTKLNLNISTTPHHNRFTALFLGPPGWAGARRKLLLDFMVIGRITRGTQTLILPILERYRHLNSF